jgi:hypothetical protein
MVRKTIYIYRVHLYRLVVTKYNQLQVFTGLRGAV